MGMQGEAVADDEAAAAAETSKLQGDGSGGDTSGEGSMCVDGMAVPPSETGSPFIWKEM